MADFFSIKPRRSITSLFLLLTALVSAVLMNVALADDCAAQSFYPTTPSYYPHTIARPQDRTWIRNLPMEQRPNRPLHFYGNMVRRSHSVQRPSYDLQPRRQSTLRH